MKYLLLVMLVLIDSVMNGQPSSVTAQYFRTVGGSTSYYYWVQAFHLGGVASPLSAYATVSNTPATLTGADHVSVRWTPVQGAVSYNVYRTTSSTTPTGACNCLMRQNISANTYDDNGTDTPNTSFSIPSSSLVFGGVGSTGQAVCWKDPQHLGYCSSVVSAGGSCTCN